jgi:hypothetical protein
MMEVSKGSFGGGERANASLGPMTEVEGKQKSSPRRREHVS